MSFIHRVREINIPLLVLLIIFILLILSSVINVVIMPFFSGRNKAHETLFKISMKDLVLELRRYASEKKGYQNVSIVIYYGKEPDYCLEIKGQGGKDYHYFSYVKEVKVEEDGEQVLLRLRGENSLWNFTSTIRVDKRYPGFLEVELLVTLKGGELRGGMGGFYATNGRGEYVDDLYGGEAGWHYPLVSATYPQYPIIVEMRDSDGKYLFSAAYCDLSGKGSIYALKESRYTFEYNFEMSRKRFGLKTPNIKGVEGTFISTKYYLYAWRSKGGSLDSSDGFFSFLNIITSRNKEKGLTPNNMDYISNMVKTLETPPNVKDVYATQDDKFLLKAYIGDRRNTVFESEFITQANTLLGLSYLYNRTQDSELKERLEKLILNILGNTSYFDVYFDDRYGIYSNNWGKAGRMDSWYQVTNPSMLLAAHSLAPNLVKIDLEKHKRNADWLIRFARKVNYSFPVFVYPNFVVDKPGVEADAALGYSYLMVKMYTLTKNSTYLHEAMRSLEHYISSDYGKLYEAHLASMGVAATAHLYRILGEDKYLDYLSKLVYLSLRWINLHRGNLIEEEVPFTLVSAMPGIYAAAFEYGLFKFFLEEAYNTLGETSPNLAALYKFYSLNTAIVSKYSFPQVLGIKYRNLGYGKIDEKYWVPIEDIYPVLAKPSGRIPQEIYGYGSQIIALYLHTDT
ncbi:MAG: hypothetical protein J7L38_03780 [Thermoproteales archaeon]|nr:hypothetical protein [Thermoproteales archaeon]